MLRCILRVCLSTVLSIYTTLWYWVFTVASQSWYCTRMYVLFPSDSSGSYLDNCRGRPSSILILISAYLKYVRKSVSTEWAVSFIIFMYSIRWPCCKIANRLPWQRIKMIYTLNIHIRKQHRSTYSCLTYQILWLIFSVGENFKSNWTCEENHINQSKIIKYEP